MLGHRQLWFPALSVTRGGRRYWLPVFSAISADNFASPPAPQTQLHTPLVVYPNRSRNSRAELGRPSSRGPSSSRPFSSLDGLRYLASAAGVASSIGPGLGAEGSGPWRDSPGATIIDIYLSFLLDNLPLQRRIIFLNRGLVLNNSGIVATSSTAFDAERPISRHHAEPLASDIFSKRGFRVEKFRLPWPAGTMGRQGDGPDAWTARTGRRGVEGRRCWTI